MSKKESPKSVIRFKMTKPASDLDTMTPKQLARYLVFADPSNPRVNEMLASIILRDRRGVDITEKEREHKNLVWILKATEARNRLRDARLQYQNLRAQEINFLISFQRNAKGAVRLEVFLPPRKHLAKLSDCMDRVQRQRIEEILEDDTGEVFIRRH